MKPCPDCGRRVPDSENQCPDCGADLREPAEGADELIGRKFFGEYTITDRLGKGGMGAVYLAEQDKIDQRIALKVLHADTAESDEVVQRFHREAKVISMLSHPNIVRVFIFGRTEDDLLFLAMEHVEGIELRDRLEPGRPLDENVAIKIMKQTCSAVAEAHDLGILHRDLKPENLLLTEFRGEENFVKILDFGLAKIEQPDSQDPKLTQAGIVFGTPEYLSPEQARADDLDHRTDIYALGCMLFEMMTGHIAFDSDKAVEILKKKAYEDPPRASGFGPVSPTMDEIIAKAMARDREERFDSAMAMFEALEQREREMTSEKPGQRDTWFPGQEIAGTRATMDGGAGGEAVSTGGDRPAGGASRPAAGGGGTSSGGPASPPGSDRSGRSPEMSDTVAMEKPPSPVADGAEDPAVDWNDEGEAQHAGDTRDRGPEPNAGGSSAPSGPSTRSEPSTGSGSHDNRASARSDEQASRPPADDAQNKPSLDDDPPNETLVVGTIIAGSIVVGVLLALAVFYFFG